MNPRAAALTIGLHAALLVAVLPSCVPPPAKAAPPPTHIRQIALPVFIGIAADGTLACERFYLGFGVTTNMIGRVWDVAPGSPAERAFIREGDVIENANDFSPDSLPEGTEITLQVRRGDVLSAKRLRIGRVCYR